MKSITLDVCQGVGDIFWVYQKFAPHFDEINFNVCRVTGLEGDKLQNRAMPFVELFPKVNKVDWLSIHHWAYNKLAARRFKMEEVIADANEKGHSYFACNRDLEDGIRIEDIDPDYSVQETVELATEKPEELPEKYVCLYISGNTFIERMKHELWTVEQWMELIEGFYSNQALLYPIALIGASYDVEVMEVVKEKLEENGHNVISFIDRPAKEVTYILKNAKFMLGYASGMCILADNFDVKQLMMYPRSITDLMHSWPKKSNIENGFYNAALFDKSPQEVLDELLSKVEMELL